VPEWTEDNQKDQDKYIELRQTGMCDYDAKVLSRVHNNPMPDSCPKCGGKLASGGGMVGETVLYCPNKNCEAGILWEDYEGAMARIL